MNHLTSEVLKAIRSIGALPPFSHFAKARMQTPCLEQDVAGMAVPPVRLKGIRPDDQFVVSYPRSGNTWVRYLLRDVIALSRPELPDPSANWNLLPDIHVPSQPLDDPVVQSFQLPTRILKSHNLRDLPRQRMVYIFRHPADALVSYYHFHLRESRQDLVASGIDSFCRTMIGGWIDHVRIALEWKQKLPDNVLFIGYERLQSEGKSELCRILEFLGLCTREGVVSEAWERNAFAKLRANEEARRGVSEEYFFRKGKVGSAHDELSAETLEFIAIKAMETYQQAIRASQPFERPAQCLG